MTRKITVAFVAVAGFGLVACTNPDGSTNNAGTGATVGAVAGAAIGNLLGKDTEATIIGAAVGGAAGAAIGNNLDRQQAALEQDIGGSGARIINTGDRLIVSLPEAITFATESATVRSGIRNDILAIANNLQEFPNTTVQVIGHTDNTGTAAFNQNLSERRAAAVASILRQGGVSGRRIAAFGVGENQPIASNSTASGRQQNRRVEIVITPNR